MATTDEMRTCRLIGHAWDAVGANRKPKFGILIMLRCERCTTIRNDLTDRSGLLLARYYEYAEGYRDAEITSETKDDRRRWFVKELLAKEPATPVVDIRAAKRARKHA